MTTPTPLWSNHRIASKLLDKVEAGMDIESASGQLVREMRDDYAAALAARDAEIASLKAQAAEANATLDAVMTNQQTVSGTLQIKTKRGDE